MDPHQQEIELKKVVSLLELTYLASSDQQRKSAEQELNRMASQPLEMSNILMTIITSTQVNRNFS